MDLEKRDLLGSSVFHEPGWGSSPALMTMQSNVWFINITRVDDGDARCH